MTNSQRERGRVRESAAREKLFLCYCENLPPVWHLPLSTTERHHQFSVWLFIVPCSVCVLCASLLCPLSAVRCSGFGVGLLVRSLFVAVRCSSLFVVHQWSNDHSCKRTCRVVSLKPTAESTKRKKGREKARNKHTDRGKSRKEKRA